MEVIPTKTTFRNYLFFWSGQLFSLLGTMVVDFILIWWIQIRTGSVIFGITNLFLFCGIIGILITIATYLFTNIRHSDYERKIEINIPEIIE